MKEISAWMLFTLIAMLAVRADAQLVHNLPDDPNQHVLKVEEFYEEENNNSQPMILIYADGRVVKPVSSNEEDNFTITIEANRLNQLLKEIIEDNKFLDMEAEAIKDEVVSERKRKRLRSSFEFRIEMNLADKTHVVSVGNTWVYQRLLRGRTRHKDAKVFQRFLNVEELCRKISNWALVGGEASMQTIIEAANKKTQEKYPGAPEITESNILSLKAKDGNQAIMYLGVAKTQATPPLHVIITKSKTKEKETAGDFEIELKINHPRPFHGSPKPLKPVT